MSNSTNDDTKERSYDPKGDVRADILSSTNVALRSTLSSRPSLLRFASFTTAVHSSLTHSLRDIMRFSLCSLWRYWCCRRLASFTGSKKLMRAFHRTPISYIIHIQSFRNVTLALLWVFPIAAALLNAWENIRFIIVWVTFSLVSIYIISMALKKPMEPFTPRIVYNWFYRLYQVCSNAALIGYIMVLVDFALSVGMVEVHSLSTMGILLVFYGIYFGVIGRDLAEFCSDRMAQTMGFTGKTDELISRNINEDLCGVCGGRLVPKSSTDLVHDEVTTISCNHSFHEKCLRGWIIVGKKHTCPYCSEKVTYATSLLKNPWETQSVVWGRILDAVRYLIVWNPIIIVGLNALLSVLDPQEILPTPSV